MRKIILLFTLLPIICYGQQINTTFGSNGSVITDYANDYDFFGDLLTLPDGKLLLFGNSNVATNSNLNGFAVIKYNEDGSYDNSFGIRGKVILNFDSYQNSNPTSAILQNDGKILVAGNTANNYRGAIMRLLPNGEIDTDFGFNGKIVLESKEVSKILLTPDQKIIILGKTTNDFSIEKLNSDGFYDLTFGTNGITTLDDNNTFEKFTCGEILNDGSLICFGNSSNPNFQANNVVFAKFSANGIFDSVFGLKRITTQGNSNTSYINNYAKDLKVLSDNSILLLVDGSYMDINGFGDSRIYKIDMNGNLNPTFANNGYFQFYNGFGDDYMQNIILLNNGDFFVTLKRNSSNISTYLFNSNGTFNTNFSGITVSPSSNNIAFSRIHNDKMYIAYNLSDYQINSYLIDSQFLSINESEIIINRPVVYPNPFTEKLNINLKKIELQNTNITIFNSNGSEIFSKFYKNSINNEILSIDDLSTYSAGIYFLKIQSDNDSKTFKIIKK
ncbi:Secretion system C-terminal sorting domain-containing protein [Flavobacterium branchiophilum]|uniref:Secretion system C-terminal sorting domain-containing protein n=1 Tax=Flavobacterium branchiophilum (strain FL-15) TaxID=1034807 RepID=G2Z5V9_FLABF|nr:T9SS type A sorting domain-containing protein [Flavobacterium branchiophilum]CCB68719.1 Protein of unknown function precursor [Flavobacterium branchiophilum FL-15]